MLTILKLSAAIGCGILLWWHRQLNINALFLVVKLVLRLTPSLTLIQFR